jgi:hypothetical protein
LVFVRLSRRIRRALSQKPTAGVANAIELDLSAGNCLPIERACAEFRALIGIYGP